LAADNRADDQIGIHEFDHMAFVSGEEPRPRLAAMAHLGIAQRQYTLGGDATPNATLSVAVSIPRGLAPIYVISSLVTRCLG
jgi:hypothetical protein